MTSSDSGHPALKLKLMFSFLKWAGIPQKTIVVLAQCRGLGGWTPFYALHGHPRGRSWPRGEDTNCDARVSPTVPGQSLVGGFPSVFDKPAVSHIQAGDRHS